MPIEQRRPSLDEYFLDIAALVAKRSTCLHRKVGAVLVRKLRLSKKICRMGKELSQMRERRTESFITSEDIHPIG